MTKKKEKIIGLAILVVCLVAYWWLPIGCPMMMIFKIPCPGCGMMRACNLFLHGDFVGAFTMHPMLWSTPLLLLYFLKDGKLFKNKWINNGLLIFIGLGFLANWIYQLVVLFA